MYRQERSDPFILRNPKTSHIFFGPNKNRHKNYISNVWTLQFFINLIDIYVKGYNTRKMLTK